MMRWVKVEEVGDTEFLLEEVVDRFRFALENERVLAGGGKPAVARPLLMGITKASLSTDSFISAASFQETTRVLTEAAISGKGGLPARPEGKRDHGPADSCRHRSGLLRQVRLSTDAEAELPPVEEVAAEEARSTPAEFSSTKRTRGVRASSR